MVCIETSVTQSNSWVSISNDDLSGVLEDTSSMQMSFLMKNICPSFSLVRYFFAYLKRSTAFHHSVEVVSIIISKDTHTYIYIYIHTQFPVL